MAFRFKVDTDGVESFTKWYDEPHPSQAAQIATKIRQASPEAKLTIERKPGEAAELNKGGATK